MNDNPFPDVIQEWRKVGGRLARKTSMIAKKNFVRNFRLGGYYDERGKFHKWKDRQEPDAGRATLVQSGRLRRSMRAVPKRHLAQVISDTPYSRIHNEGGTMRGNKRVRNGSTKSGKPRYNTTGQQAHMTARPYMVTSKPILDEAEKELFKMIDQIW